MPDYFRTPISYGAPHTGTAGALSPTWSLRFPNDDDLAGAKPKLRSQRRTFIGASRLDAIGHWAPSRVVTSEAIAERLSPAVHSRLLGLERQTGVRERRVFHDTGTPLELAMHSVAPTMDRWLSEGNDLDQIDLVIYASVTRQMLEPATATLIHHELGLQGAIAFDVTDACLGFVDAWCIADSMIAAGRIRSALLVCAEIGSPYTELATQAILAGEDVRMHFAALTLGDGSAAAIVSAKDSYAPTRGLWRGVRESYGEHHHLCVIPAAGQAMLTQPGKLVDAAMARAPNLVRDLLRASEWTSSDVDLVVPHQVTVRHTREGMRRCDLPEECAAMTIDRFGNMASVSVPFTLSEAIHSGRLFPGSRVLISGFGSGLGIGMLTLEL